MKKWLLLSLLAIVLGTGIAKAFFPKEHVVTDTQEREGKIYYRNNNIVSVTSNGNGRIIPG